MTVMNLTSEMNAEGLHGLRKMDVRNFQDIVRNAVRAPQDSWDMMCCVRDAAIWINDWLYKKRRSEYTIGSISGSAVDGRYESLQKEAAALLRELLDGDQDLFSRFGQTMLAYQDYMIDKREYATPDMMFLKFATGLVKQSDFIYKSG